MRPLVILGAGGHGREVLDVVEAINRAQPTFEFLGFLDDGPVDSDLLSRRNVPLMGETHLLESINADYLIGIGSGSMRRRLDAFATAMSRLAATAVHPLATIGSECRLEAGVVLAAGARLTTNVQVGRHTHLNVNATVSHDSVLDAYVTLNPGATVAGNVRIGESATLGAGSTIIQGRRVGENSLIGAGAVVVDDIHRDTTAMGVPARTRS